MKDNIAKFDLKTIKRLFGYIKQNNRLRLAVVIITIIINTISVVAGSLYLTVLIDNYIVPLIGTGNPDYASLIYPISVMIGIYIVRHNNNIYINKGNGKSKRKCTKSNS